jgi:hypothetical protein
MKSLLKFILKLAFVALILFLNFMIWKPLAKDYWVLIEGTKTDSFFANYKHADQPECTVVNGFMVTHCDFKYESVKDPSDTQSIFTFMLGPVAADEVYFMESAKSGIVSTNYQLDHMINRTLSAILLLVFGLAGALGLLVAGHKSADDANTPVQRRRSA